jgi:hypothetical protein
VRLDVRAKHGIDAGLVARSRVLEKVQHVAINAQRDLLFGVRKVDRLGPDGIRA